MQVKEIPALAVRNLPLVPGTSPARLFDIVNENDSTDWAGEGGRALRAEGFLRFQESLSASLAADDRGLLQGEHAPSSRAGASAEAV
jgi:hypothetical protein